MQEVIVIIVLQFELLPNLLHHLPMLKKYYEKVKGVNKGVQIT